jgi:GLPGLI family protein
MKMYKMIFLSLGLFSFVMLGAQGKGGRIIYEVTVNIHRNLPPERAEEMKKFMPEFQVSNLELLFNETMSLCKNAEKQPEAPPAATEQEGMMRRFMMRRSANVVFRNLKEKRSIEQTDFMDKTFLISDETEKMAWKITGEQKMINGYLAIGASYQDSLMGRERRIKAYFTPSIPISAGPQTYAGLPGLVIMVDINEGAQTLIAKEITMDPALSAGIIEPDKGKAVTRKEYNAIVAERMKEMGANGQGGMQIRMSGPRN